MDEHERAVERERPVWRFADLGDDTGWNMSDELVADDDGDGDRTA